MNDIFNWIWDFTNKLLSLTSEIWQFLNKNISIKLEWFKIPLLLPNGFSIDFGFSPLHLFGAGLGLMLVLWIVKALIPIL